uniref:hypothetical protein n=1 Tax=Sphingobacterium sp. UBA7625 TaxID=1947522 RepID=UPI00257E3196
FEIQKSPHAVGYPIASGPKKYNQIKTVKNKLHHVKIHLQLKNEFQYKTNAILKKSNICCRYRPEK